MAQLLVRMVDGENPQRYMREDCVVAVEDGHIWGRLESLDVWTAEGLLPADWPGGFAILDLPGMTLTDALVYCEQGIDIRRIWTVDINQIASTTGVPAPLFGPDGHIVDPDAQQTNIVEADGTDPVVVSAFTVKP